ncbi:MAG: endospore germination permease [Bacillota bacterium]|nr:endospore germination permease [Bacillota bacterium]
MSIEKGRITGSQLMFLVIGILQSATVTSSFITEITRQNTWIALLIGFAITVFLLLVYTSLTQKFAGKNIVQINSIIYGDYLGTIISILYIYFFWLLVPANSRLMGDFLTTYVFSYLDVDVFIIGIIIISAYALRKGIEVMAKSSIVIVILTSLVTIVLIILTINYIKLSNFLPLLQIDSKELIQGINLMVTIPFGDLAVFLIIFPYMNDINQVKKYAIQGVIIGGIGFLIVNLRNTAVLGKLDSISMYPAYELAKLVSIGEVITRTEVLVALAVIFLYFLKISIFYYATVLSIAQLLKLKSYKPLVIPVGIISIVFGISMYKTPTDEFYSGANIYPIYAIPCVILLPIISLVIAYIRKLT